MAIYKNENGTPILYSSAGSGHAIKDSTTTYNQRSNLKFMGNVEVTDDPTTDETVVSITAGYIVYPTFDINNNGHLIATGGAGVDFTINNSGHLIATPQ